MNAVVGPFDTQDLEDLAAYYASVNKPASFSFETGELGIPNLIVDNVSYNVKLKLTDIDSYTFVLDSVK